MKILLLNPPFKDRRFSRASRSPAVTKSGTLYYPIWLAYATGVLEKAGFDVKLVDAPATGLSRADCARIAAGFKPDLIVIDTSTPSIYSDTETAGIVKEGVKGAFLVLVGTHPSALPEETLNLNRAIDAVTIGEYDYTLRDLARSIASGGEARNVAGIVYRDGNRLIHNETRPLIEDLDDIPYVSSVYKRHLDVRNYFFAASYYPMVMIVTGRGCPFQCSFCLYPQVFHSRRYRFRSPENIAAEFEYVSGELPNVKEIGIEDDTFTVDARRVQSICGLLMEQKRRIPWYANTRPDLDYETMRTMKEAGCRLLIAGFESGSQEILDNIHKGIRIEQMTQFKKDADRAGLLVHGCFMIGNPEETRETIYQTIDLAERLNCDTAQFLPLMAYPGTEIYNWARKAGYIKHEDFSKWATAEGLHNTVIDTDKLSHDEVVRFADYARRRFYLRPSYIFNKALRCLADPRELAKTVKSFRIFYKHLV